MKEKLTPLGRLVLVEPIAVSTTIQLPSTVEPERYKVVEAGWQCKNAFNVGETVVISYGSLTPIKDTPYFVTNEDNVMVKIGLVAE